VYGELIRRTENSLTIREINGQERKFELLENDVDVSDIPADVYVRVWLTAHIHWPNDPNDEGRYIARYVEVVDENAVPQPRHVGWEIIGKLIDISGYRLTVRDNTGKDLSISIVTRARVDIPDIEGENNVNQLKHHLEIQRMSKSKGNVVNPDELVAAYGSDTVRAYLMFAFDWQKGGPWDPDGIKGPQRWINEVWDIVLAGPPAASGNPQVERQIERRLHQTIERVTDGLEKFSFNTAIAALMEFKNELRPAAREGQIGAESWSNAVRTMLVLMAPFTPHVAEELWSRIGGDYSIHNQSWPVYDADKAREDTITLVVQAGKKVIDRIEVPISIGEEEAKAAALAGAGAQRILNGGQPRKVIFIPGRGNQEPKVNIVT
jgi:leucyl-tRNA synthetase